MRIALVAHIPYDRVFGTRKHAVQRNRKFDDAEIACEVTAVFAYDFDNRFSDFTRENGKLGRRKFFNILRGTYAGKDRKKTSVITNKKDRVGYTNTRGLFTKFKQKSFVLVSVFPEHLLSLMCRHLLTFSFFSAGHNILLTSNSVFQYRKIRVMRQDRDEIFSYFFKNGATAVSAISH